MNLDKSSVRMNSANEPLNGSKTFEINGMINMDQVKCQWCGSTRNNNPGICPNCCRFPQTMKICNTPNPKGGVISCYCKNCDLHGERNRTVSPWTKVECNVDGCDCETNMIRSLLPSIQTNQEQERAASEGVDPNSLVAMIYLPPTKDHLWTWKVEFITDNWKEADKWWESQNGPARVYYGTGHLRHAK